jgi:hypothetical protein
MFAATSGEAFGYRRPCSHHGAAVTLAGEPAEDAVGSHHAPGAETGVEGSRLPSGR